MHLPEGKPLMKRPANLFRVDETALPETLHSAYTELYKVLLDEPGEIRRINPANGPLFRSAHGSGDESVLPLPRSMSPPVMHVCQDCAFMDLTCSIRVFFFHPRL